jgi:2-keto-3-deoxy-galactonokinase
MPSCRITNHTSQPLNICLKQVTALHFENGVSGLVIGDKVLSYRASSISKSEQQLTLITRSNLAKR